MSMQPKSDNKVIRISEKIRVKPEHLNSPYHDPVWKTGIITYINRRHNYFTVRLKHDNGMKYKESFKFCDLGERAIL